MLNEKCLRILGMLLKEGEVNQNVTVIPVKGIGPLKETIRDALSGEIVHSRNEYVVDSESISEIYDNGKLQLFRDYFGGAIPGVNIVNALVNKSSTVGIRITINKRVYIIVSNA